MRERLFVISCLIFVVFSFTPTLYELYYRDRLQPNRAFELVHNFYTDYNFYLSRIRQGIEGNLTVVEKYTSEPHEGSFIQYFYLFLGWVGRLVRLPPDQASLVYLAARIVFGTTLLYLVSLTIRRLFQSKFWQLLAFLTVVTAGSWPIISITAGKVEMYGYMRWWSVVDSLQRILFIPHLMAGQALIFVILSYLTYDSVRYKIGNWLFFGGLGLLLGVIFPPGLVFVYVVLALLTVVEVIQLLRKKSAKDEFIAYMIRTIGSRFVFIAMSAPVLLYIQLMVTFYPWKRLVEFDLLHPTSYNYWEYMAAIGPVLPFGLLGAGLAFVRKQANMMYLLAWVAAWQILLELFRHTPQTSPLRLTQMGIHIPLGILSTYFFTGLLHGLRKTRVRAHTRTLRIFLQSACIIVPLIIIVVGGVLMAFSWKAQKDFIDHKMRADTPLVPYDTYVMYPLKDFIAAMKYLEASTNRDGVVLSDLTTGNYVPVYSGNTSYIGHDNTVFLEQKIPLIRSFFSARMDREEALSWLKHERISYIFFGPQEQEIAAIADLSLYYPFLKKIYQNVYVTLYHVTSEVNN